MERIEGTVIATVSSTLDYITVALMYRVLVQVAHDSSIILILCHCPPNVGSPKVPYVRK